MPIRPENRARYPKDWKEIRTRILERAKNACEFCYADNYAEGYRDLDSGEFVPSGWQWAFDSGFKPIKIVLTIAHLDHQPENNDPENLRALCQRCHNRYDAPFRAANRKRRMEETRRNLP